MSAQTTTVRISGKRGKVTVAVTDGATVRDVLIEAATTLGFEGFEPAAALADGQPVGLDEPADAANLAAVPAARLG